MVHAPTACSCKPYALISCFFCGKNGCHHFFPHLLFFCFFIFPSLCQGVAGKMLIIVAVFFFPELQDRLPQRMCSRERRLPPSSNHRLCTPWQCQRWISQYNLICETKCLACNVGPVRSGTLKMATWGLDDVTWSSPSCYLLWSLELRVQFLWIVHGFLKYIAMKGSFLIQKCRNSVRKTAGIRKWHI